MKDYPMNMTKISMVLAAALTLGACATPQNTAPRTSGTVYSSSETGQAMRVAACSVVRSRYVSVVGDSRADQNRSTVNQAVGIGAGALIGRAVGNKIGGGSGNDLAKTLGTLGGGVVGSNVASNVNANRTTRTGVEYTVNLGSAGQRTIVQNLNPGEVALPSGSACAVTGNGSSVRVLAR
jgi:outer membrane lipoprotein SlyB